MSSFVCILTAYLIGSLSFAVVISQWRGLADPRTYGSQNPGATNIVRSGQYKLAAFTLLGDALKGWFAVFLAQAWVGPHDLTLVGVILAVVIGHCWPVFFRFSGGKGVATALGILFWVSLWLGAATLTTWLIIVWVFRYSSLAAIVAAVFTPFFYWLMQGVTPFFWAILTMSMLLIFRHASNIRALFAGTEARLGQKTSP